MQNIRISINCQKLAGVRIIRSNNHAGEPTNYVAIPMSHFFIPKDAPATHLMLNLVPSPNALYGDFMVKPYVDPQTYDGLTAEQRRSIPIIGKGSFIKSNNEKSLSGVIEKSDVTDVDLTQCQNPLNSPSEARSMTSDNLPFEG